MGICLSDAYDSHKERWIDKCDDLGRISAECQDILNKDPNEYVDEQNPSGEDLEISDRFDFYEELSERKSDCSCRLEDYIADDVNDLHRDAKDQCFRRYPQK